VTAVPKPIDIDTPCGRLGAANRDVQARYDEGMANIATAAAQLGLSADMWDARLKAEQAANLAAYQAEVRAAS
jgi:hypothetical protein